VLNDFECGITEMIPAHLAELRIDDKPEPKTGDSYV
jgi:hypothetical protein